MKFEKRKILFFRFSNHLVLLIEIRIRRKMCFAGFATFCGVKKWICIWKVIKLRPNIGLIVRTRMFTGAEVGRTAGDLWLITRSGRFLAPSLGVIRFIRIFMRILSLFWKKYPILPTGSGKFWQALRSKAPKTWTYSSKKLVFVKKTFK